MRNGGAHERLNRMAGSWRGVTRTWFEPGKLADESPTEGYIHPYLNGRFLLYEYQGTLQGEKMQGTMLIGCNLQTGQFEVTWVDNLHMGTGMMFSVGEGAAEGFSVLGSYPAEAGPPWGWRTVFEQPAPDELIIRAYNIPPESDEALAIETVYRRE